MRLVANTILTVAGGLVIAVILFYLTAPTFKPYLSRVVTTQEGHVDFWTGEITPRVLTRYSLESNPKVMNVWVDPEPWENYRVIPLPVGFVIGSLLTLTVITVVSRRPGRPAPNSAVRAA